MEEKTRFFAKRSAHGKPIAEKRANIVNTIKILFVSDFVRAWKRKGEPTNTFHALVKAKPTGEVIVPKPNPPKKVVLDSTLLTNLH